MLAAFASAEVLTRSYLAAADRGYRWHEFGDVHLLLP
jgi:S-adenosylmethionine:tRNA ribosyltransferase-isomerase